MIVVSSSAVSIKELEAQVDEDIAKFDAYQQKCLKSWNPDTGEMVGVPLTGHERALIKTFLGYKLGVGPRPPTKEERTGG